MILTYSGKIYSIMLNGKTLNLQKIVISFGSSIRHYKKTKPVFGGDQAREKIIRKQNSNEQFFHNFVENLISSFS